MVHVAAIFYAYVKLYLSSLVMYMYYTSIYCGMPGSPCLSKTGLMLAHFLKFLVVCHYEYALVRLSTFWQTKGSLVRVLSQPGAARAVLWKPRPAGTQQDIDTFFSHLKGQSKPNTEIAWYCTLKKIQRLPFPPFVGAHCQLTVEAIWNLWLEAPGGLWAGRCSPERDLRVALGQ